MNTMDFERIVLHDEEGAEVTLSLLATYQVEEEDYCCMQDDDGILYFMRYVFDGEQVEFETLEGEALEEAISALESLTDASEEDAPSMKKENKAIAAGDQERKHD